MTNQYCSLLCHINVRIAWTVCGILIGVFWSLVYIIEYKNWSALTTCLVATSFAFETLFLYWSLKRDKILKWSPLVFNHLFWINLVLGTLGLIGMTVCIILAATKKQGFSPKDQYGENWWSTATWFLVLTKWTWQNSIFAWVYRKKVRVGDKVETESIDDPSQWKY